MHLAPIVGGKQKDIKELLEISCSKDGLQQKHDTWIIP